MAEGGLQRELKKKRPFASPAEEAVLNLHRTADRIGIRFARLFGRHGLTPSQYNVLRILRGEGRPMKVMEVAARTLAEVPGITGVIDRMVRAGLVARERCDEDRRVVFVAVTDKGLRRLAQLDGPVAGLHERLVGHLSREELTQLSRLLEKARERCDEVED
jgi:DNA-binding MarR family transcriptional regulator